MAKYFRCNGGCPNGSRCSFLGWRLVETDFLMADTFGTIEYKEEPDETPQLKARLDLLPPMAALAVGRVLAFGDSKHPDELWKRLSPEEHQAAALRHIYAHLSGVGADSESKESHLAHAICRLAFAIAQQSESK